MKDELLLVEGDRVSPVVSEDQRILGKIDGAAFLDGRMVPKKLVGEDEGGGGHLNAISNGGDQSEGFRRAMDEGISFLQLPQGQELLQQKPVDCFVIATGVFIPQPLLHPLADTFEQLRSGERFRCRRHRARLADRRHVGEFHVAFDVGLHGWRIAEVVAADNG